MKLALVVLALVPAVAYANDQSPLLEPYAPFKLVGAMPDTGQVLLWDEHDAEYRLAKVGDDLGGWRVSGFDPRGPRVSLQKEDLIDELELDRLPRPGALVLYGPGGAVASPRSSEPVASATPPADAPAMPSSPGTTTITTVPLAGHETPAPVSIAPPSPPAPAAAAPVTPETPTIITAPRPQRPPAALVETRAISRAELDREINDFDSLMAAVYVEPAEGGGFQIVEIEPASWVASLGFRKGDVVRRIAGETISSIEDAARLYARLRGLSSIVAEIERGAQRVNLRIDIR